KYGHSRALEQIGSPGTLPELRPSECPLGVKSADWKVDQSLPIYPDKPTISDPARTSHSG
ncbi:hypothetical protein, partial [Bradyrhizobium sp. Leo170]|uniref:hypothetical protein n=1 Tax=Bradyrhizobium sp. Leo170 TaxID=1571199 RepID=UPI001A934FDD